MTELTHRYRAADRITLVIDNLSTHSREILRENLEEELGNKVWDRFETSAHASWLNQAEIAIGMYSGSALAMAVCATCRP
jgi:hypothetical protein